MNFIQRPEQTEDDPPRRVVIAGGSGFLGQSLARFLLGRGYHVVILSRTKKTDNLVGDFVLWDGVTVTDQLIAALEGAYALVNLAGKNVNAYPTPRHRQEVIASRVQPTEALGDALLKVYRPPSVWIQASSLAIYGNAGDRVCDEAAWIPERYPTDVCLEWEAALGRAIRPEMRWTIMRIGFVLGAQGGALPELVGLARKGLGGAIGTGEQWISWIHEEDMNRLFLEAIESPAYYGIFNATGMQPVRNGEFMRTIRTAIEKKFALPFPGWLLVLGAKFVNVDPNIALDGRRCIPRHAHRLGFRFRFHELGDALVSVLRDRGRQEAVEKTEMDAAVEATKQGKRRGRPKRPTMVPPLSRG